MGVNKVVIPIDNEPDKRTVVYNFFMTKIVVTSKMDFSPEQKARLQRLGDVTFYDDQVTSPDEWLKRVNGYEIICSWMAGLREKYSELSNVFISVPFVGVGTFADPKIIKAKNITISNSPGCNRHAVSEWIIYMMLTSKRRLDKYLGTTEVVPISPPETGLAFKTVAILGYGNIGKRVGEICKGLEMKDLYFKRGDNLLELVKDADFIVDTLSTNSTSKGLLNKNFFNSVKKGAVFISVTTDAITDIDAMLVALNEGKLSFVCHDIANAKPGDAKNELYNKLRLHPNTFVTPHIAGFSDVTTQIGNDIMIDNVEAWLKGKPINVFEG